MSTHTIDTATVKRLVEARAIHGAAIIGQPGGWSVLLKYGMEERPLGIQRADRPRLWRSLDTCVDYLKEELHIGRVDLLDATGYSAQNPLPGKSRPDAAERMRKAFAASYHDHWFREQVEIALKEADDPATEWVSHEEVEAMFVQRRSALRARSTATGAE
ncbi:conserved protein of unknown function (plasmid) [Acidithiobacillus ferrivorans]|uniref:Uncharacterized protein n=1 Tax=Acidithiobacillus ferrivorans TaxID=160808 RepID=A0A060UTF5_9PROT|nr:hypothetical protein [Acidithiobacillus ferrivorans]CDQ11695.1 conserved hypothetical protein [Acidithiobacillus ferrivorans]SMH67822.1 conserved protein of unknown function [Acidithiobacillus ferrivorans]